MRSGFIRRLSPEGLSPLHPHCPAPCGLCSRLGAAAAASCAVQLHGQNVCPHCLCWCYGLFKQGRALASKTFCVTYEGFFFPMTVKIFQAERVVHSFLLLFSFFLFLVCSQWRSCNILKLHLHIHIIRLMDSERGLEDWARRFRCHLWTAGVGSMPFIEVMALRGISGHSCIFGLVQTPPPPPRLPHIGCRQDVLMWSSCE